MESSSKNSKLRKGVRHLMDKLSVSSQSRSRSQSPSQSSHQLDAPALSPASTQNGGSELASRVSLAIPSAEVPITNPQTITPPIALGSRSIVAGLNVPIVLEQNINDGVSTQSGTKGNIRTTGDSESGPTAIPAITAKSERRGGSEAWVKLRISLRLLHDSSSAFPPFLSAFGVLLSCIDGLETISKRREGYEELAMTLGAMSDALQEYTSSMVLTDSVSNLVLSLERQATEISERLKQIKAGDIRDASANEEQLIKPYKRLQSIFQQIQANVILSTWRTENEQLARSRLEGLKPVRHAEYDSDLSTEVSRRSCTEGTRTKVLGGLDGWLHDSSSPVIYWMNGMAGTGKTTIAYSFCEQVEKRKQLAASFFCTRNSVDCRSTSQIIPTVTYQLARYSIPCQHALYEVLGQNPDIGSKYIRKQFEQLLIDPLLKIKHAMPDGLVVVIDALDECHDRNGVGLVLDILFRHAGRVPLKFLITSRPEPEIYNKMHQHQHSRAVIHLYDIETSLVREDIELYLREELAFMIPTHTEIEQLAHRSGCLFIYAATLTRYILYGKRVSNPRQRLKGVLSLKTQSTKKHAEIDALYSAILQSALREANMEDHETDDIKAVLRTVLSAQEPIDVKTIAVLGGLDDPERVLYALQPLRSVIYHSQRSGGFYCDVVEYSQLPAQRCFGAMKAELRFNICVLESSFIPDVQVDDLRTRIKANITPTLAYVCQYWATHLGMANKSGILMRMLYELLSHRLLFWMEVMNVKRMITSGIEMLHKADQWTKQIGSPRSEEHLIRLVEDSYAFVTYFVGGPTSRSTPHIYISCLPFCSHSSQVYKHYWNRTQGLLQLGGNLIDYRDSAALASWQDSEFTAWTFSPDGAQIIGGSGNDVLIRNVYNGTLLLGPMNGHTKLICACAFSSDGSRAVSASKDGTIYVWDAYSGTLVSGPLKYDTDQIRSVDWSEDGIVDVIPVPFKGEINYIKSLDISPNGTRIVACFYMASTTFLLDTSTGKLVAVIEDPGYLVNRVAMAPDGTTFASVASGVHLWSVHDGTPAAHPYTGHTPYNIVCVAFTPDSIRLVSCSRDIQVWNRSDGSLVSKFAFDLGVSSLAVSPDGTQVASGSNDRTFRIWNIDDGTLLAGPFYASSNTKISAVTSITMLKFMPDGTRVTSRACDGTVAVWRVLRDSLAKARPPLAYPISLVDSILFSADEAHVVTHSPFPHTIRKWDVHDGFFTEISDEGSIPCEESGKSILYPNGAKALYSPNGLYAVIISPSSDNWCTGTNRNLAAQFFLDSSRVAIGLHDGTISLWNLQSREVVAGPFFGFNRPVRLVVMSPDRSLIASATDSTLRIFNVNTPVLDIAITASSELDPTSTRNQTYEGWTMQEDGWVVNSSSHLLFCVPLEFKKAWPSPHTSLVVTEHGTVQVPKQTLYLGEAWHQCFITEVQAVSDFGGSISDE
ncbi:hypothetical protein B0J17DRAFT_724376 [Rhizoctonia solani]|nr:hypothetical protein B0J17DRAFT_724376 [Rhizoctonia solani]